MAHQGTMQKMSDIRPYPLACPSLMKLFRGPKKSSVKSRQNDKSIVILRYTINRCQSNNDKQDH